MKIIEGGVCAAKGFTANGIHCGIRKNHSKNLPVPVIINTETRSSLFTVKERLNREGCHLSR